MATQMKTETGHAPDTLRKHPTGCYPWPTVSVAAVKPGPPAAT